MESAINSEKDALRWAMRRAMAALTPEALHTMGKAAAALLAGQDCWKHCSQVLVFRSLKHEIDTAPLISLAQEQGKTAFVTPQKYLAFEAWHQRPGDLVIVPGLAFDRQGERLGQGGGFYDRFFAELQTGADSGSPFKVGYCASCQFVDRVPVDKNDVSMDALCTELSFYIL